MGELSFILYYNVAFAYKNFSCSGGLVAKSCLTLATPWIVTCQAPLPVGFSRQEYWSGLPFLSPGDLPDPGIEPRSPTLQTDSLLTELWGKPIIRSFYSHKIYPSEIIYYLLKTDVLSLSISTSRGCRMPSMRSPSSPHALLLADATDSFPSQRCWIWLLHTPYSDGVT